MYFILTAFLFLIVVALLYKFPLKMFNIKDFINLV